MLAPVTLMGTTGWMRIFRPAFYLCAKVVLFRGTPCVRNMGLGLTSRSTSIKEAHAHKAMHASLPLYGKQEILQKVELFCLENSRKLGYI